MSVQLLVLSDEDVIGIATLDLDEGASSHEGALEISVLSEYRGEGIGSLLLDLIIFEAQRIVLLTACIKRKGLRNLGDCREGFFTRTNIRIKFTCSKASRKASLRNGLPCQYLPLVYCKD